MFLLCFCMYLVCVPRFFAPKKSLWADIHVKNRDVLSNDNVEELMARGITSSKESDSFKITRVVFLVGGSLN